MSQPDVLEDLKEEPCSPRALVEDGLTVNKTELVLPRSFQSKLKKGLVGDFKVNNVVHELFKRNR